jgi:cytochrome c oxidase subunit 3
VNSPSTASDFVSDPFNVGWRKLMMWIFIAGDALLFASFLAAYGFNRLSSPAWPDRSRAFSLTFVTAMTFVLITSSATMATSVHAARKGDTGASLRFLILTLIGGMGFLGMQAWEWTHFIREGAGFSANPWGVPGFSAFFFMITGFHGTHVLIGLIVLAAVLVRRSRGRGSAESVELAGLYWHFVDLVWVFVFGGFYLL